jgi:hypothetical protein
MEAAPDKALPFNGGHEVTKVAEVAPDGKEDKAKDAARYSFQTKKGEEIA